MSAIEEHKEKRRALGRGLDSLLPSGPRLATAAVPAPAVMPPPVMIPTTPSGHSGNGSAAQEVGTSRAAVPAPHKNAACSLPQVLSSWTSREGRESET